MSGGSYDYLFDKVEDAARRLLQDKHQTRKAFGRHLLLVSKALHDIEWVDSSDMDEGDDLESILKCITPNDVLEVTIEDAKSIMSILESLIVTVEMKRK